MKMIRGMRCSGAMQNDSQHELTRAEPDFFLPRTDTWQAPAATAQEAQGSHCLPRRSRSGLPFVTEIPNSHVTAVLGAESGCKLAPMLFSILQGIPRLSQE